MDEKPLVKPLVLTGTEAPEDSLFFCRRRLQTAAGF